MLAKTRKIIAAVNEAEETFNMINSDDPYVNDLSEAMAKLSRQLRMYYEDETEYQN